MTIYKINCPKCKKETLHRITNLNLKRGFKLQCASCGYIRAHYIKANKLENFLVKFDDVK